jgi:hypothetical protein
MDIEALANTLESQLRSLSRAIAEALPREPAPTFEGEVDWGVVKQVLAALEPLLAASSMQANLLFDAHAQPLRKAFGPSVTELEQYIGHFLYPEALQTLRRMQLKLP